MKEWDTCAQFWIKRKQNKGSASQGLQTTARWPNAVCEVLPSGPRRHFIRLHRHFVNNEKNNTVYFT